MKISLGPIPYLWGPETQLKFYREIAKSPIEDIFLGEVVCSRRSGLHKTVLSEIVNLLEGSGKKVYLSSLGLVTNDIELETQREIVDSGCTIEANDFSIVKLCHDAGKDFIIGPYISVYNRPSLEFLRGLGAKRVVLLPEIALGSLSHMIKDIGIESEIMAFGKPHLAFSWRCYTARMHNLTKDACQQVCSKYPGGCTVSTIDNMPIYSINGTEIMGAMNISLLEQLDIIKEAGITHIRIIPQEEGTGDIASVFSRAIEGRIEKKEALELLKKITGSDFSNGWFFGEAGWRYVVEGIPASTASVEGEAPSGFADRRGCRLPAEGSSQRADASVEGEAPSGFAGGGGDASPYK